jgi:hypothetical protein
VKLSDGPGSSQRGTGPLGNPPRWFPRCESQHSRPRGHVTSSDDPLTAQKGQTVADVEALGTAGVVHAQRRLAAGQRDLAHRHPDPAPLDEDLVRARKGRREIGSLKWLWRSPWGHGRTIALG